MLNEGLVLAWAGSRLTRVDPYPPALTVLLRHGAEAATAHGLFPWLLARSLETDPFSVFDVKLLVEAAADNMDCLEIYDTDVFWGFLSDPGNE